MTVKNLRLFIALAMVAATVSLKGSANADMTHAAGQKQNTFGRYLFFCPMISTSMKITFAPIAEELASR
jgi:hypothetical protein